MESLHQRLLSPLTNSSARLNFRKLFLSILVQIVNGAGKVIHEQEIYEYLRQKCELIGSMAGFIALQHSGKQLNAIFRS